MSVFTAQKTITATKQVKKLYPNKGLHASMQLFFLDIMCLEELELNFGIEIKYLFIISFL